MPRVVFRILWDFIQAGRPIVAFVKNLAHDGRYYWVVALVTPMPGGYLSVRFKPTSPLLATVKSLYAELRAAELVIEADSNDRKAAIEVSRQLLATNLKTLGFGCYEDFMGQTLKQEMQSRASHLGAQVSQSDVTMFDKLLNVLNSLFDDLEAYVGINQGVRDKSGTVTDISESLRVSALNGVMAADKLGAKAAGLRPVLDSLRALSAEISKTGVRLSASLEELASDVDRIIFGLSAAKLQIEMTAQFAHELHHTTVDHMREGAIEILHSSSCKTVRQALTGLENIKRRLRELTESQDKLLNVSLTLRPVYLTGKIEMADVTGPKLAAVFQYVGRQLQQTGANLDGLAGILRDLDAQLDRGLLHGARVEQTIVQIDSQMHATT